MISGKYDGASNGVVSKKCEAPKPRAPVSPPTATTLTDKYESSSQAPRIREVRPTLCRTVDAPIIVQSQAWPSGLATLAEQEAAAALLNQILSATNPVDFATGAKQNAQGVSISDILGVVNTIYATLGGGSVPGAAATESFTAAADSISVVSTLETTILTYTAATDLYVDSFIVSGQPAARYKLKVNGITKATVYTAVTKTTEEIPFGEFGLKVNLGEVVTITGYHEDILNKPLSATISGHYVVV